MEWPEIDQNQSNELVALFLPNRINEDLLPLCNNKPIPFLNIMNKYLLEFQIHYLEFYGFSRILFAIQKHNLSIYESMCSKLIDMNISINLIPYDDDEPDFYYNIFAKVKAISQNNDILILRDDFVTDIDLNKFLNFHISRDSAFTCVFLKSKNTVKKDDNRWSRQ